MKLIEANQIARQALYGLNAREVLQLQRQAGRGHSAAIGHAVGGHGEIVLYAASVRVAACVCYESRVGAAYAGRTSTTATAVEHMQQLACRIANAAAADHRARVEQRVHDRRGRCVVVLVGERVRLMMRHAAAVVVRVRMVVGVVGAGWRRGGGVVVLFLVAAVVVGERGVACRGRRRSGCCGRRWRLLRRRLDDLLARHNVDEKVELLVARDGECDIVALQRAPLVLLGVQPGANGHLLDEELGRLGEYDRRLGADHLHLVIQLHYLLDPGQWQLGILKVRL